MTALFTAAENPARGSAVESLPQAGPVSPTSTMEGNPLMSESSMPRGPGLFEVTRASGERVITNVRRLAGAERPPGSVLVATAAGLLGLLAAGLFVVSLAAQYRYVLNVKHDAPVSVIEAIGLDAGMTIFSLLALGLARAGQSARIERVLIVACALGSAAMNYAAADGGSPRSVAAYCMPPVFLAVVVDRVVAVVRRHVLGDDERSAWSVLGLAALYALRCVLAPPSTAGGLRRWVLAATPLPAAERPAIELVPPYPCQVAVADGWTCGRARPCPEHGEKERCTVPVGHFSDLCWKPLPCPDHTTEPPELAGASKKARLAWWYEQDAAYGDRGQASAAASRIAPVVGLGQGTARAYVYAILAELEKAEAAS
jgi:hypothetical protein